MLPSQCLVPRERFELPTPPVVIGALYPCALPLTDLGIGTETGLRTHKKTDLSRSRLPITLSRHIDFLVGTVGLEPTLNWF